ncbi:MAG TPA: DUF2851 family protein [Candidatus Cloacimonadota bacterium]|nr:DUF2851 family protein [Candidatus Cloacimonadota bacterium]
MDLNEKFLYHIWDAGHLKSDLKTISGKSLRITFQGQFNTGRGPDFSFAIIELEGQALQGSVEIHLKTSDWKAHAHEEDPYYNRVILHVVLSHNQNQDYTIKEDGERLEILELKNQLSADIQKLLETHDPQQEGALNTYCELLSAIDNDNLSARLALFGKLRFRAKVRRFNAILGLSDFDQLVYEGMMEALGYDKNKLNFFSLASAIPLQEIKLWKAEGLKPEELIAIFTCSSGLLQKSSKALPEEQRCRLFSTYESQNFYAQPVLIDWQLFRVRPGAHPLYRLIAFLSVLYRFVDKGLMLGLMEALESSDDKARLTRLQALFSQSTTPGYEGLPKPGKDVLKALLLNIYLPILYLWHEKHAQTEAKHRLMEAYLGFPPLQENHVIRSMQKHINPSQIRLVNSKAVYQQGLQELYNRYCSYHLCNECTRYHSELQSL